MRMSPAACLSSRFFSAAILGFACLTLFFFSVSYVQRDRPFSISVPGHGPQTTPQRPIETTPPAAINYPNYAKDFQKPAGMRIIALVFFGRKEYVEILDCYLKRNLIENGGVLDEVIFAIHTDKEHDLEYLDHLITTSPRYTKYKQKHKYEGWTGAWESVKRGNIYIKIDDDVVYFEDAAIPSITKRLIENPQYFAVSANSINNPQLTWIHYSLGVYEPYWPELQAPNPPPNNTEWRPSQLPTWEGPADYKINGSMPAPYMNHRWLPLRKEFDNMDMPIGALWEGARIWFAPGLFDWTIAAQTHYSFLEHIERNDLWRYRFHMWDYKYERISINFIAFRGDDIVDAFPFPKTDDEEYLTVDRPKAVKRHIIVDGTVLSAHYGFGPQRRAVNHTALTHTDVLSRYAAFAKEMVCPFPSQADKTI